MRAWASTLALILSACGNASEVITMSPQLSCREGVKCHVIDWQIGIRWAGPRAFYSALAIRSSTSLGVPPSGALETGQGVLLRAPAPEVADDDDLAAVWVSVLVVPSSGLALVEEARLGGGPVEDAAYVSDVFVCHRYPSSIGRTCPATIGP